MDAVRTEAENFLAQHFGILIRMSHSTRPPDEPRDPTMDPLSQPTPDRDPPHRCDAVGHLTDAHPFGEDDPEGRLPRSRGRGDSGCRSKRDDESGGAAHDRHGSCQATDMATIACTLNHDDLSSRRARWAALASHALLEIETTRRGLRLVFAGNDGVAAELRELAELERECCAFATWTVEVDVRGVALELAGIEDAAVPAVRAMFGPLRGGLEVKPR